VLGSLFVADPLYPPNAVSGGTVVAELRVAGGSVKDVTILSGTEPFVDPCASALAQWRFQPERDGSELVVVYFRQPYLYNLAAVKEEIAPVKPRGQLPFPKFVVQPSYPPNASGQGSVVLQTDISTDGRVAGVKVVKPMGVLTETSIKAVERWEFIPAQNAKGTRQSSHAYVVLVFRFPLAVP